MFSKIFNLELLYKEDESTLIFWRKKIFKSLFLVLVAVGSIPYILSLKYAIQLSEWHRVGFYTGIYLWGISVAVLDKIAFPIRVWAGITGFYLLGLFSLTYTGFMGSTRLYLLCFSAFAAIFAGFRASLAALFINVMTLAVFGFFFFNGTIAHSPPGVWPQDPMGWVVICATFTFLSALVTAAVSVLIKAVEISGNEFKLLIKNASDLIWTMDQDSCITFVNSAAQSVLGFTQQEMIGRPMTDFVPQIQDDFLAPLETEPAYNYETRIKHKNGTPIDIDISGLKIRQFSEEKTVYQGLIRDISQKKRREKEKQRLKEKLAQAEKLEALGVLAGSVAHDLNNILSGIATFPEILMLNNTLTPEVKKGLGIIKDSGQKASAVVSDLLTVSRGTSADMEVLNLATIIERYAMAHDFERIRVSYPGVTIDIINENELLNIKGSYIHLEKLIMNLVLNAVEEVAGQKDGRVSITTANRFLDSKEPGYEAVPPGEYAVLTVSDNGSGIEKAQIKNIFDPFFTKKEMGKSGTGLGLTVVWNAVQDHKGHILVSSNQIGTTFEVFFPGIRQELPTQPKAWSIDEIKGQGQQILVVDDLKEQQNIALTILDSLGYKAEAVDNGYDAVEFIKTRPVDLVILDMIMAPSISGLETYRMIKKINPDQKAILASGYSESDDVTTAQELGAGRFVKKPYTVLDMGIAIKEELEK